MNQGYLPGTRDPGGSQDRPDGAEQWHRSRRFIRVHTATPARSDQRPRGVCLGRRPDDHPLVYGHDRRLVGNDFSEPTLWPLLRPDPQVLHHRRSYQLKGSQLRLPVR